MKRPVLVLVSLFGLLAFTVSAFAYCASGATCPYDGQNAPYAGELKTAGIHTFGLYRHTGPDGKVHSFWAECSE